jgi:hypothetical protein
MASTLSLARGRWRSKRKGWLAEWQKTRGIMNRQKARWACGCGCRCGISCTDWESEPLFARLAPPPAVLSGPRAGSFRGGKDFMRMYVEQNYYQLKKIMKASFGLRIRPMKRNNYSYWIAIPLFGCILFKGIVIPTE